MFLPLVLSILAAVHAPREWRDSIRDVYIDGKLERNAQTLTTSGPRMIAVVCGEEVLLLDPEKNEVARVPKKEFTFAADRVTATTSPELTPAPAGSLLAPNDETFVANVGGRSVVVSSHQSPAGPLTVDELWATAPTWRAIAESYEPNETLVARLKAIDEPMQLQVVMATWCGDSRQHVPRLLKSIATANNPNITVELIGVGPEFVTPMETIAGANITNVPTVIVARGGKELGRFVETPANGTIEDDVCDIESGTPKAHPSRYERGALQTSGTYEWRDARRRVEGTERFEIYERPGGGSIAHSVLTKRDGATIETWASIDADRKPRVVEVTHRARTATRTRFRRNGDEWSATSRGTTGGIIDQTARGPQAFVAPATITYAWARGASEAYIVPERGVGASGTLDVNVADGDVPKWVKFADGRVRTLRRR
ncbi:MAG TPA: thioredoxin family protein [Thermoanaerobaculia bacterium]|nr:thioredoxin family protein [Thermoanaerobaculia bacterium]